MLSVHVLSDFENLSNKSGLETFWTSKIELFRQSDGREALEQDFETYKEVSEYETLGLPKKISNFELVSFENEKSLHQLQELETRRRNVALMKRQHEEDEEDLTKKIQLKFSRSDMR